MYALRLWVDFLHYRAGLDNREKIPHNGGCADGLAASDEERRPMAYGSWKGAHTLSLATALTLTSLSVAPAQQAAAPALIKIGIVTFLTGPAAAPFGIPGRNAAEILVENLNAGKLLAPYNQVGLGGAKIEVK